MLLSDTVRPVSRGQLHVPQLLRQPGGLEGFLFVAECLLPHAPLPREREHECELVLDGDLADGTGPDRLRDRHHLFPAVDQLDRHDVVSGQRPLVLLEDQPDRLVAVVQQRRQLLVVDAGGLAVCAALGESRGSYSLCNNDSGDNNVAVGYDALRANAAL
jgi:hypothetical protein